MGAPMKAAAMKGKTAKALTKGAIAQSLADACELKKAQCMKVIDSLAGVGTKEVSKAGIFTIPGLCRIKTRVKPETKAGKKEIFGKMCMVKARPARTIVKAFAVAALKASVRAQQLPRAGYAWAIHGRP